ncbi:tape measure protein [Adlercreutzia sp. ZJ141]|uniref:tape measure protein n=1 Tax=Adlercreutzia sp. ZJ141 TaxID=2709406 RepID=UPI0013ED7B29|nr:tape measure protein [Adlercreutzia sp. ZJ141]
MAVIGKATLNVVPKFPGLSAAVKAEFAKVDASEAGERAGGEYGRGMGGGLVKSGAAIGAFSAMTNMAMESIASHVGDAAARFDTLNNYPRTMENLGFGAQSAEASIEKMSSRLQGLPTRLDDMVSTVQGLAVVTRDLDLATDAGLALNDMLVASGSSTQLTTAAMEQFRQMLAKGKPELEDWKSFTAAMPGQMDQLAKSMLGPTATANDLYAALGGGGGEAILSMDDLLRAMVRLDNEGGESFASFREQAETASGGVQTSVANMGNAVTRGIADVMDAVGSENIAGVFDGMKGAINKTFDALSDGVRVVMPPVKMLASWLRDIGPSAVTAFAGFSVARSAGTHIQGFADRVKDAKKETTLLAGANKLLGTSMTPASLGLAAGAAAFGLVASAAAAAYAEHKNFVESTEGLADAVSNAAALDGYSVQLDGIASAAGPAAKSVSELAESMAQGVGRMNETTASAQAQISELSAAQQIINDYAGKTDLSAEAQGRLEWALQLVNEQFGLSATAADVAADAYVDADGNAQDLTDTVNNLIEAKKEEIRISALTENLSEAYKMQADAAATYAAERREYNDALEEETQRLMIHEGRTYEDARACAENTLAMQGLNGEYLDAKAAAEVADGAVAQLEGELGDAARAASDSADEFDQWGASLPAMFSAVLSEGGTSLSMLKDDLRELGVETSDLSALTDEQLLTLADSYDGTAASIVGTLDNMGVGMDDAVADTARMVADITETLTGMDGVGEILEVAGVSVTDFAGKLGEAGVSSEQLNAIGSDNLMQLAANCQGNMDAMVWSVQHYNDTSIVDKDGNIVVERGQLIDAQGRVYTWNGTDLVDQDGNVAVADQQLQDAQGRVYTWNGSHLAKLNGSAHVNGNIAESIRLRDIWNGGWFRSFSARVSLAISQTMSGGVSRNAAGGIRLNAEGGYRMHADGAIATRAVPLDIVGEDGAEAIVPLTNRRYSQPFVDLIAEGVRNKAQTVTNNYYSVGNVSVPPESAAADALRLIVDYANRANAEYGR